MSDPLAIYLHDHLAGSHFAVELLESLTDQYSGEELGGFAGGILAEIKEDQQVLEGLIGHVAVRHFDLKSAAAWLGEKVSRVKLGRGGTAEIGTFEALELLALGIQGKLALWRVMQVIAEVDSRVRGNNFAQLAARAENQFRQVEEYRLKIARNAFTLVQDKPVGTH